MTESSPDAERLIALLAGRAVAAETFDDADWMRLIEFAKKQWVAPMLFARLRERKIAPTPAAAQQLRELFLANIKRNTQLLHELGIVLRALQAADIAVIPLKGACLAEAVYGNVALRQMGDLDLLVKPAELTHALDVLTTLGYSAAEAYDIESERQLSQHMPRLFKRGGVMLDLHWTLVNPWLGIPFDECDLDQVWSRAVPVKLSGVNVSMFSPVDLLLYLVLHTSVQHRFDGIGLRSFWDMALVIRRYGAEIDWEQFTGRMNQWGIVKGAYLTLLLMEEWTDIEIPAPVRRSLKPSAPDAVTIGMASHRILDGGGMTAKGNIARPDGKARIADLFAALRDVLLPTRLVLADEYHVPANSWRILCYYPVRFMDLWMRHPQAMWQVLRRDKQVIEMQQELDLRQYLD